MDWLLSWRHAGSTHDRSAGWPGVFRHALGDDGGWEGSFRAAGGGKDLWTSGRIERVEGLESRSRSTVDVGHGNRRPAGRHASDERLGYRRQDLISVELHAPGC